MNNLFIFILYIESKQKLDTVLKEVHICCDKFNIINLKNFYQLMSPSYEVSRGT